MYMYMYMYMYVYMYMYMCMYMYMYMYMHVCMYACMHACMHVCVYACMHICMYACMHVCMHVCMYVRMYVCMYVCPERLFSGSFSVLKTTRGQARLIANDLDFRTTVCPRLYSTHYLTPYDTYCYVIWFGIAQCYSHAYYYVYCCCRLNRCRLGITRGVFVLRGQHQLSSSDIFVYLYNDHICRCYHTTMYMHMVLRERERERERERD